MISRSAFLVFVLLCGAPRCGAAPSLSFDGVTLGQTWEGVLKAHPKAKVFFSIPFDNVLMPKAQRLRVEAKNKDTLLFEAQGKEPLSGVGYFFQNHCLTEVDFSTDFLTPGFVSRGLVELKPSLQKMLDELGPPTSQGMSKPRLAKWRQSLLVWKTPTQCAYARVTWPLENERVPTSVDVWLIDAPWRGTNPKFKAIWPNTIVPNQDDETRRRELFALLEELRPHSTDNIGKLEPAPDIGLSPNLNKMSIKPKPPAATPRASK